MKKYFKKIVAFICMMTLCIGSLHITNKANEVYAGSIPSELTLHNATNKNANAGHADGIYVAGYDTLPYYTDWSVALTPDDTDNLSGVWVGEERKGGELKKYAEDAYHVGNFGVVSDGQIVTVKGTFRNTTTNEYVNIQEVQFIYTNGNWEEIVVNPDEVGRSFTAIGSYNNATQLSLKGDDNYTYTSWDPAFLVTYGEENGIFYNGTKNNKIPMKRIGNCEYYFGIGDADIIAQVGDEIKIKGTFTHNTYSVQYNEVKLLWDGSIWVLCEDAVDSELTLHDATNKNANAGHVDGIYVAGYDTLPYYTDWSVALTPTNNLSGVWVGEERKGGELKKYAEDAYHVGNFGAVSDGQVVTVKGIFGNVTTNEYVNIQEIQFIYTNGNWEEIVVNPDEVGRSFTASGSYNNATQLSLKGDDNYTYTSWDPAFLVTYGEENGIFYNGTKNNKIPMKRIGNCEYYFGIGDADIIAQVGDEIKIKGTFTHNTYSVQYNEVRLLWNGSTWVFVEDEVVNYPGVLSYTTRDGAATYVYLDTTDTMPTTSWDQRLYALNADSGIYVNGVRNEGAFMKKVDSAAYYVESFGTLKAGDILKIKGLFGYSTNNETVSFDEAQFQWDGTKWKEYVEVQNYPGVLSYTTRDGAATYVYLDTTDTMPTTSWEQRLYALNADSGIYVNGVRNEGAFMKKVDSVAYYVESFGTLKAGDILKIKGLFGYSTNNETVSFDEAQFQWTGTKWIDYVEIINYPGTLSYESGDATHMYLSGTDTKPSLSWDNQLKALNSESGIYVNDSKIENAYLKKYNHYQYYLGGFGTVTEGAEITIKGLFGFSEENETVTIDEVVFQYEGGNCWIEKSSVTSYKEGAVWLNTTQNNTAKGLYLLGSVDVHENCTPEENPDFGWTTSVGTAGFYKNDEACSAVMKNIANGAWYVDLGSTGIADGDKFTIRGTYGYAGRYVKLAEYTLWYTEGKWSVTPAITTDTKVYGDTNGDAKVNSEDIVRIKRYLANQPVSVYRTHTDGGTTYATGANANGVDGINDKDRYKIYELILEGKPYLVDGEGYTVDYYPVYLDDEDVKLGAYHGPRMAGKNDYTWDGSNLSAVHDARDFMNTAEFKRYKEAGLNTLLHEMDGAYSSKEAGIGYGVEDGNLERYFRLAKEAGLDVYVTSLGLNSYIKYEGAGNGPTSIDFNKDGELSSSAITIDETKYGWDYNGNGTIGNKEQMTEIFYYSDNIKNTAGKTILEADVEEMLDFIVENDYADIFRGFMLPDEPWLVAADRYASAVALIKREAAERGLTLEFQGCLYPDYAVEEHIGSNYANYINAFGNATGSIMYDFYPLLNTKKWYQQSFSNVLHESWITNLQTVAAQGKEKGYTTGITLQSCGYEFNGDTGMFANQSYRRNPQSNADIQFQVYSALAFGMKKINYFTYWEHPNQSSSGEWFTSSMVEYPSAGETAGKSTKVYDYVQKANKEITAFDHIFMDYDWQGTISAGNSSLFSDLTKYTTDKVTIKSSTGTSIVSHMYDDEKNLDGYWLVNVAEPSGTSTATLKLEFSGKNKAMVFVDGEKKIIDLTNGVYEATLPIGEGIFIIPLNIQ